MITLHGEEVKEGDRVWHVLKGWGEVLTVDDGPTFYPILVHWEEGDEWFTEDGKYHIDDKTPVLFWQPTELRRLKKPSLESCHYEYPVVDESEESDAGAWPVLVPNGFKIVKDNQPTDHTQSKSVPDRCGVITDGVDGLVAMSQAVAGQLLCIRDLLVAKDYDEAYHALYSLADPDFTSRTPWQKLEDIAKGIGCHQPNDEAADELREVYEAARQFLRYYGVDKDRASKAMERLEFAIETVKNIDGGYKDFPLEQPTDDRVRELENKYNELLMAVASKFPNETRHETALRYIRNAEAPAIASMPDTGGE